MWIVTGLVRLDDGDCTELLIRIRTGLCERR
jgi:hypothetical protein